MNLSQNDIINSKKVLKKFCTETGPILRCNNYNKYIQ